MIPPVINKLENLEVFSVIVLVLFAAGTVMGIYNTYLQVKINKDKVKELGI